MAGSPQTVSNSYLPALWEAVRPRHWVKNGFCLAALFFSGQARDLAAWLEVVPVFIAFCAFASAGYLLNDVLNCAEDRAHPRKRKRAIASGRLTAKIALQGALLLVIGGTFLLGSVYGVRGIRGLTTFAGLGYFATTALYSLYLRRVPYLDVLVLASGFVIRVAAGAFALGVTPTAWLLATTYLLSLLLGYGKRLGEWHALNEEGEVLGKTRSALGRYTLNWLRVLVLSCAVGAGGIYFFYALFHPQNRLLLWSVVPVVTGLNAYLRIAWRSSAAEMPEQLAFKDPVLIGSGLVWGFLILFLSAT